MVNANKVLDLLKLPNILIIHLQRFLLDKTGWVKNRIKIVYPMNGLTIDHLVPDKLKEKNLDYDLIGVCNHYGTTTRGHCK